MNKLYYCLLIVLSVSSSLQGQVSVKVTESADNRFQFVNKITGQKVNDLIWDETESFVNGFAKVSLNRQWGFVDQLGNTAIQPAYQSVRNFVNHLAAAQKNYKWGFINEKGEVIIPFEYTIAYDFKESVTAVYKNGVWFLLNKQGVLIRQLDIDAFLGFKNGTARITKNGLSGSMNTLGVITSMAPAKKITANTISTTVLRSNASLAAPCPDNIGFESGTFLNWSCFTGSVKAVNNTNVITVTPSAPTANRHVIYARTNPSAIDPFGLFPINPPDGSNYAVKLGNDVNGAEAERISYQINVPANSVDASITYRYAVVFQDPGHLPYEQPRFSAKLLDVQTNTYLPCASYEYVSTSSLPGFLISPVDDSVKYKTWASVFINLSAYAGKTLVLEFTTADCTKGKHWGYAYVDVGDCNITANVQYKCNPSSATLSGPPGFEFYNWWNDNYTTLLGTGQNAVLTPAPPLNSTIHVEVIPFNGFGCQDTLNVLVTNSTPTADAGPDKSICPGSPVTLGTAAITGNTYSWSPSTYLSNSNTATPTCYPQVTTTYYLTVGNTSNGCTDIDSVTVNVSPKPIVAFNPGGAQCLAGNSFTFTNTSSISAGSLTYSWNFGDGIYSSQTSPVHSFAKAGIYNVKLITTSNTGCKDSIIHPAVTVNSNPIVKTNNDSSICRGSTLQLQTTGAQTYTWTTAQSLSCVNCSNPVAAPITSTTYYVKGIDNLGCPGYDTLNITVHQPIQTNVAPGRTICQAESVNLLATGTASSYIWSPAQGLNNTTITNPVATPASTTQYRVVGYDGHNCFTDTGYVTIIVNPKPAIDLGPNLILSTGTVYPLTSVLQNGPIVSWLWTPSINLNCSTCPLPSATVINNITYYVAIKNSFGCTATDSISIRAFCEGSQVFIPNAFTPDGDGLNDILMVRAKGIDLVKSFRIFTRWGELIFEKTNFSPNDPAFGWDGKIRGVTGPAEVYVYTAEVICSNKQNYLIKGNTSILK